MSDIDFDELDRAVASVLSTPEQEDAPKTDSAAPAAPSAEPVKAPDSAHSVSVSSGKPVAPAAQALHPVAQKPVQRGRFLDMVHPAHDMAPRTSLHVQERPKKAHTAPHTPATPAPVSQAANQTFVSDVVTATKSKSKPAKTPAAEPVVAKAPAVLEAPELKKAPEPTPVPASAPTPEHIDFFADAPADDQAKSADQTPSPFIPDAKVEKRPLGAFSGADGVPADSGDTDAPLPVGEELHEKLVAVESEDNVVETPEPSIPVEAAPPTTLAEISPALGTDSGKPEHHGLFDRFRNKKDQAANPRIDSLPKHGKGTLIWITVAIAVVLIGVGVGASLYFVVIK